MLANVFNDGSGWPPSYTLRKNVLCGVSIKYRKCPERPKAARSRLDERLCCISADECRVLASFSAEALQSGERVYGFKARSSATLSGRAAEHTCGDSAPFSSADVVFINYHYVALDQLSRTHRDPRAT